MKPLRNKIREGVLGKVEDAHKAISPSVDNTVYYNTDLKVNPSVDTSLSWVYEKIWQDLTDKDSGV